MHKFRILEKSITGPKDVLRDVLCSNLAWGRPRGRPPLCDFAIKLEIKKNSGMVGRPPLKCTKPIMEDVLLAEISAEIVFLHESDSPLLTNTNPHQYTQNKHIKMHLIMSLIMPQMNHARMLTVYKTELT
ncbi:hypothetical protein Dimus_039163 [Dionaea muscipula]